MIYEEILFQGMMSTIQGLLDKSPLLLIMYDSDKLLRDADRSVCCWTRLLLYLRRKLSSKRYLLATIDRVAFVLGL